MHITDETSNEGPKRAVGRKIRRADRPTDPADPTTWKVTLEVDPTPRTEAQDRAWAEWWQYMLAEAQRRLAARN
jgi:hypothetical protein